MRFAAQLSCVPRVLADLPVRVSLVLGRHSTATLSRRRPDSCVGTLTATE